MKTEDEIKIIPKKVEYPLTVKQKRVFRPRIELKKCERCMLCVVLCPDNAITVSNENPHVDYSICKGCLICLRECPFGAIAEERE